MLYDTITVGYWKAISVKNCILAKDKLIFLFSLLWTVNTIWFVYSEYLYFTFQLNHYEWLTNTLSVSCNILVYCIVTDVHHCINCIFSFSKILYKIFIANILCEILFHCKYYCSLPLLESKYIEIIHVGLISSKVNHFSAFKILKTYILHWKDFEFVNHS